MSRFLPSVSASRRSLTESTSKHRPKIGFPVNSYFQGPSTPLILAKNQKTFDALKKMFQTRKIKKSYLAIVYGQLDKKEGVIEKALARSNDYKKQTIASEKTKTTVRSAVTAYKVQKEMADYSLVEVFPKTGRTHQIRIHLWSIGHPVVGDTLYKRKNNIALPEAAKRQLLHAQNLSFKLGSKSFSFEAKMPKDMKDFLTELKK